MKRWWAIAGTLCVALLAASGCSRQSVGPTTADFQKQRAAVVEKQKQMAALQLPTRHPKPGGEAGGSMGGTSLGFVYDPVGRRDPFRSFILDRLRDEDAQTKGPLEEYDLSQLDLAGMVWRGDKRRALVIDPSGQGYVVEEGDRIGKNDGRVLEIGDSMMRVREEYMDAYGEKTLKEIDMRIRQSQGG
ncbi:MAG: pilus assembly protein PilP [Myxococcota bacterium]